MSLSFKKKGYPIGTVRNYGKYGLYKKQVDGTWKRLKKGYPQFRRTVSFKRMKQFLTNVVGYGAAYVEKFSSPALREMIKSEGLMAEFNKWIKEAADAENTIKTKEK